MALPVNGSTHLIPAYYWFYRPRKDERLSWPSCLTYSGWLTHISGHPSAAGRAQDRESSLARDRRSTTVPRHQLTHKMAAKASWHWNYVTVTLCITKSTWTRDELQKSTNVLKHNSWICKKRMLETRENDYTFSFLLISIYTYFVPPVVRAYFLCFRLLFLCSSLI